MFRPEDANTRTNKPTAAGKGGNSTQARSPSPRASADLDLAEAGGVMRSSGEGQTRLTQQELSGLVSKLKQKAQQRKTQPVRPPRKGKVKR